MPNTCRKPTSAEENALRREGFTLIAGVDEVGRGALMGPVVAAAVIMPANIRARWKSSVKDSKQLTPETREYLNPYIREKAIAFGIGATPNDIIDSVGIGQATRMAMISAVAQLKPQPEFVLVDYLHLHELMLPQKGITGGDSLCFTIACASIIAKVYRDHLVSEMDKDYAGYGFTNHKGYGTREHLACLREKGPCALHRRSFRPVREIIEKGCSKKR